MVLPVLGPSDVRDAIGRGADDFANPRHYLSNSWVQWGMWGLRGIDNRSRLLYADTIVQQAYDPYAFIRNAYLQHRDFKVSGGQQTQDENQQEQQLLDEADQAEKDNAATAPADTAPTPPASPPPH